MIKILFFIEKFAYKGSIGGAEKVLLNLVNHMDPKTFDITVETLYPESFAGLLNENVKYKYCYPYKTKLTNLIYRIEAELGLTYPLHVKDDYDIEVAFLEFDSTKVIAASTNMCARKVAWVHCDFNIAITNKESFVKKVRRQYANYDYIVFVSRQCERSFIRLFGNGYKTVVLPNVIDNREIINKSMDKLPDGVKKTKTTLCTVGRFSPPKNHFRLLRACRKLLDEGFDFELWLIGDGELRNEIETTIEDLDMKDNVKLYGFQSNPYPFMKVADLLVCSSDYEGYSTFVSEGVILERPIITTDCSGMQEILKGYDMGMIVDNDDHAFTDGLRLLIREQRVSTEPRVKYASLKSSVERNEDFFKSLLY